MGSECHGVHLKKNVRKVPSSTNVKKRKNILYCSFVEISLFFFLSIFPRAFAIAIVFS